MSRLKTSLPESLAVAVKSGIGEWQADLKAKSGNRFGNPWADIATATQANRNLYFARYFAPPRGDLFNYAITLVRATSERAKPDAERLPEYTESALPLVHKRLLDARPIYPWLDQLNMEWSMSLDMAIEAEAQAQAICMQTADFERAYAAFANKTKPVFEGN